MSELDADRPSESATADVALITRGITVTASVDVSSGTTLVVRPGADGLPANVPVKAGDLVEVYWAAAEEERSLPARIVEVEGDDPPTWRLEITGPSARSQRRKAVRVPVQLPVSFPWADGHVAGVTEDLSEAGFRARVDGWGLPPDPGAALTVRLTLGDDDDVVARGKVVRVKNRAGAWILSVQLIDLPEHDEDRLRRRVFTGMRERRAAEADAD